MAYCASKCLEGEYTQQQIAHDIQWTTHYIYSGPSTIYTVDHSLYIQWTTHYIYIYKRSTTKHVNIPSHATAK